jgi:hypothetical protein
VFHDSPSQPLPVHEQQGLQPQSIPSHNTAAVPPDLSLTRMGGPSERTTPNNGSEETLMEDYNQTLSGLSQRADRGEESESQIPCSATTNQVSYDFAGTSRPPGQPTMNPQLLVHQLPSQPVTNPHLQELRPYTQLTVNLELLELWPHTQRTIDPRVLDLWLYTQPTVDPSSTDLWPYTQPTMA